MRSYYVRRKNTLHSSLRILSHLWNMVVVVSWLGPVLLHLGQDSLPSLMEQWILIIPANSKGKRQPGAEPGDWSKLGHHFGHPAQNCSCCPLFLDAEPVYFFFFASTSNGRLFRRALQLCLSARPESNEHGKGRPTSAKWASVEQGYICQ